MITSSAAGRLLEALDAIGETSGMLVRVGGCHEDVADAARDAARLIREMQAHDDPELREALAELRELRAEVAELQRTPAAHAA